MDHLSTTDPLDAMIAQADVLGWAGHIEYASAFDRPELNAVLALWREKGRGGIPSRADFDARALKSILRNLWMLEEVANGAGRRYRYRFVGSEIAAVYGETTGRYIDEVIPAGILPRWMAACEGMLRCHAPLRVTTNIDLPQANYLSLESFHAPLLDADSRPTILMCVSFFGRRNALG